MQFYTKEIEMNYRLKCDIMSLQTIENVRRLMMLSEEIDGIFHYGCYAQYVTYKFVRTVLK
jgi:hypothetical protein